MRRTFVVSLLVAGAVAGLAGQASGEQRGLPDVGHGRYGFSGTAAGSTFDVFPFAFRVQRNRDGGVTGRYTYRQVRDGVELTVAGPLTCAAFADNRLWVGGLIEESSRASLVGLEMWFQVQDRNRRPPFEPDMSSTVGAGGPGTAQAYCDDAPAVRFPFSLDRGDLYVRG